MKFLEKDLEQIIYETYLKDGDVLSKRGLSVSGKMKRQLRIGNYGIADLVTFERDYGYTEYPSSLQKNGEYLYTALPYPKLIITIYELKKNTICLSTYLQAIRYANGIRQYLNHRKSEIITEFKIVLIGSDINTSDNFCFIPSINNNVNFYTYSYHVDGILFRNQDDFAIINNGFDNEN